MSFFIKPEFMIYSAALVLLANILFYFWILVLKRQDSSGLQTLKKPFYILGAFSILWFVFLRLMVPVVAEREEIKALREIYQGMTGPIQLMFIFSLGIFLIARTKFDPTPRKRNKNKKK